MDREGWIPCNDPLGDSWDRFVTRHPSGRFIHLYGFKRTVEAVYGMKPEYLLYLRSGAIDAVFPAFHHRSLLFGRHLISQPFSEYGGILFSPELEKNRRAELLSEWRAAIKGIHEKERLAHLEIRCFSDLQAGEDGLLEKVRLHDYGILPLRRTLDLEKHVDHSVRKNIRRARQSGLTIQAGNDKRMVRELFYPLHLRSLKRLGSPPHPLAYFQELRRNLADHLRILVASQGEVPISALLGWTVGESVQITDIASDERFFPLRANDLLHYEFIRWAVDRGFRSFDFGPVRYPGQRQYKKKWGLEFHEYCHYYFPPGIRRKMLSDRNRWVRAGSVIWRTVVPRRLAARAGKYLRRELAI